MNTRILIFIGSMLMLQSACGTSSATDEKKSANNASTIPAGEKADLANSSASSGDGMVGTWKLHLDAFDQNENQELEDEERKKGVPNNNMLQFNADGTCRIQNMFNGTYTIKEEGGKKILTVQRKKVEGEETEDPQPDKYYIKSVTKDELILLLIDGGGTTTFWIFKRIK